MTASFISEITQALDELSDRNEREQHLLSQMAVALEIADNNTLREFRRIVVDHESRREVLFSEMAEFAERQLRTPQIAQPEPQIPIASQPAPKLPHQHNGANGASYSPEDLRRINA